MCTVTLLLGKVIDYNTVWIMLVSIGLILLVLNWSYVLNNEIKDFIQKFIWLKKEEKGCIMI